jgi:molybdopterin-binding protein
MILYRGTLEAMSDIYLTPREAASELGVSYPTIKQWILKGRLTTQKTPGGHHRIARKAIEHLLPASRIKTREPSRDRFRMVSGRNQIVGTIVDVKISGLMAKIVLSIGEQMITSIITSDAAREMQLRVGQRAAAIVKSTEVMIERV